MDKMDFSELIVRIKCGSENGTGFYIREDIVMTIGHNIIEYFEPESKKIFVNDKIEAKPLNEFYKAEIILLKVNTPVKIPAFIPCCLEDLDEGSECNIYGFPAATENYITNIQLFSDLRDRRSNEICFKIKKDETINHFDGASGSPIISSGFVIAVANSVISYKDKTLRLTGVKIGSIKDELKSNGLSVSTFCDFLTLKIKNEYQRRFSSIKGADGRGRPVEDFKTRLTVIRDIREKIENKDTYEIELMKKNSLYAIKVSNLFLGAENILITAETGMGKTRICKYISYLWSKNKLWKDSVRTLIYISLREMQGMKSTSFSQFVNQYYFNEDFDATTIKKSLDKNNVMFIFDGYDELSEDYKVVFDGLLSDLECKYKIFTSKPYSIDRMENIDRHIIVNELSQTEIRSFLQKNENYETAYSFVYENDWLSSLAKTPLYLELFSSLCNKPNFDFNSIKTLTKMLQTYLNKIFRDFAIISRKNKIATEVTNIFGIFSIIAFYLDENDKTELSGNELKACIRDYSRCPNGAFEVKNEEYIENYILEYLLSCHVLAEHGNAMFFVGNTFCFTHTIFQNYFLGLYLSKMDKEKLFVYVDEKKNFNKYKNTFVFLAGLSSHDDRENLIKAIRNNSVNNNNVYMEMLAQDCISQSECEISDKNYIKTLSSFIHWTTKEENCLALHRAYKRFSNIPYESFIMNEVSSDSFDRGCAFVRTFLNVSSFLKITNTGLLKDIVEFIKECDVFDYNIISFLANHCEHEFVFDLLSSKLGDEDVTLFIVFALKKVWASNIPESKIDALIKQFKESEFWYERSAVFQILSVVKENDKILSLAYDNLEDLDDEVQKYSIEYLLDNNDDGEAVFEAIEKYIEETHFYFLYKADLIERLPSMYANRRYSQATSGSFPGNAISPIKCLLKKNLENENPCIGLAAVKALIKIGYSPLNYINGLMKILSNRLEFKLKTTPRELALEGIISSQNVMEKALAIIVSIIIADDQETNVIEALLQLIKHAHCEKTILNELIMQKCRVEAVVDYIKTLYISTESEDIKVLTSIFLFEMYTDESYLDVIIENLSSVSIDFANYRNILLNLVPLIEQNIVVEKFFATGIEKHNEGIVSVLPENQKIFIASKRSSLNNIKFYIRNFSLYELFSIFKKSDCADCLLIIKRKVELSILPYTIGTNSITTYENDIVRRIDFSDEQLLEIRSSLLNIYE